MNKKIGYLKLEKLVIQDTSFKSKLISKLISSLHIQHGMAFQVSKKFNDEILKFTSLFGKKIANLRKPDTAASL